MGKTREVTQLRDDSCGVDILSALESPEFALEIPGTSKTPIPQEQEFHRNAEWGR